MDEKFEYSVNLLFQTDDKKFAKGKNMNRRRGKSPFFTGSDSEGLLPETCFPSM